MASGSWLLLFALAFAYRGRGLARLPGAVIIAGYIRGTDLAAPAAGRHRGRRA
jgi:hypothetical protein